VWIVGYRHTVLHYTCGWGLEFVDLELGSGVYSSVWSSSPDNVYILEEDLGALIHYDGSHWTARDLSTGRSILAVRGSSPSSVIVVGASGNRYLYDGEDWTALSAITTETLLDAWASPSGDVFFVGGFGTVLRYNGLSWEVMDSGTDRHFRTVWGTGSDDVYAAGGYGSPRGTGVIAHFDGISWESVASDYFDYIEDLWGSSSDDVYAVSIDGEILHYDGTSWSIVFHNPDIWFPTVWGSSSSNVFAVSDKGDVVHFNGSEWIALDTPTPLPPGGRDIRSILGFSDSGFYAVDAGGLELLYFNGSSWTAVAPHTRCRFYYLTGLSSRAMIPSGGSIWACANTYDGSSLTDLPTFSSLEPSIAFNAVSSTNFFMYGPGGMVMHLCGSLDF